MNHITPLADDAARLDLALDGADIAPLLMVLVHLTGEAHWLDEVAPHINGPWNFQETVPEDLKARVRARMKQVLLDITELPAEPPPALLRKMLASGAGGPVPDEYIPMILEEMNLDGDDPKTVRWRTPPAGEALAGFKTVIIGAGVSGLGMAIKMREAGIPFVIYEKNRTVGGTWFENSYPGCGVDTPNHFYSLSFEPNHDWPDHFSKRDELWSYMERVADQYDIRRHIHFETEVTSAVFDEARAVWSVTTRDAAGAETTFDANAVISAVGQLNRPAVPDFPGLATFKGPKFHTARWDHSVDLTGKNVVMIGTGASGMQVGPSIADKVGRLTIFQRSAHWAVYNANYHKAVGPGKTAALKFIPFYAKWYRFQLLWASSDGLHASLHADPAWPAPDQSLNETNQRFRDQITGYIRDQVNGDAALMEKVIPPYPPYGKRMLRDNHWYKMLTRDNVDLITDGIARITEDGVITKTGQVVPADVLVLATGFDAQRMLAPMHVQGKGGQTLRDVWGDDNPRAYLGITVPSFPNLFMIYGPGTNLAHGGSAIYHSECQTRYIMQCLRELLETGAKAMDVRREPHDRFNTLLDDTHAKMVWAHRGVGNWYKNKAGRVVTNSPFRLVDYRAMTVALDPGDYDIV